MSQQPGRFYQSRIERWTEVAEQYRGIVEGAIASVLPAAVVSKRVKSLDSFLAKVHDSNVPCDPATIEDVVGIRAVLSTTSDLETALAAIGRTNLTISQIDRKRPEPEMLGYAGTHALLSDDAVQYDDGNPVVAELQLRTRAQDAWSVLAHSLVYKPTKTGEDLRRQVYRSAALVEIFDDEMARAFELRNEDPAFRSAVLAEVSAREYGRIVGRTIAPGGLRELQEVLLRAYGDSDFDGQIANFCAQNAPRIAAVIRERSPGTGAYSEEKDWLLHVPEVVAIAERTATAPQALSAAVRRSETRSAIEAVALSLGSPLPNN